MARNSYGTENPNTFPPPKPPNDEIHITIGVRYITCNADYCFYAAAGLGFKAGSPVAGLVVPAYKKSPN